MNYLTTVQERRVLRRTRRLWRRVCGYLPAATHDGEATGITIAGPADWGPPITVTYRAVLCEAGESAPCEVRAVDADHAEFCLGAMP